MVKTKKIPFSSFGTYSGNPYTGDFTVKTSLTREERFLADQTRRDIIGRNPDDAMPDLKVEAFILGQLFVRVVDAPDWWKNTVFGRQMEDINVIMELWKHVEDAEKERVDEVKVKSEQAVKSMAKEAKA